MATVIKQSAERSVHQWRKKYFNLCNKWFAYKMQGNETAADCVFAEMMTMGKPVNYLMCTANQLSH